MPRRRTWTDEQLTAAVKAALSIHGVFRHLGLKVGGGAHVLIKQHIARLGLDTSHFTGQGWNRGDRARLLGVHWFNERPLDEILVQNSSYQSTVSLKRRLLKLGLLVNECAECGLLPEWRGRPLVLRIDHVNGDRGDNRIENLRLLCPNCDSQMPTFAGRNRGRIARRDSPKPE